MFSMILTRQFEEKTSTLDTNAIVKYHIPFWSGGSGRSKF